MSLIPAAAAMDASTSSSPSVVSMVIFFVWSVISAMIWVSVVATVAKTGRVFPLHLISLWQLVKLILFGIFVLLLGALYMYLASLIGFSLAFTASVVVSVYVVVMFGAMYNIGESGKVFVMDSRTKALLLFVVLYMVTSTVDGILIHYLDV